MTDVKEQINESTAQQTSHNVCTPDGMEPVSFIVAPQSLSRVSNDCEGQPWSKVTSWVDGESSLGTHGDRNTQECKQDGQRKSLPGQSRVRKGKDASNQDGSSKQLVVECRACRDVRLGSGHKVACCSRVTKNLMTAACFKVGNGFVVVCVDEQGSDEAPQDLREDVAWNLAQREATESGLSDGDCWVDVAARDGACDVCS